MNFFKLNKFNLFFLFIVIFSSFLMLYLSFSGLWNIVHGPLYYSYAEGLIKYGELKSNMFVIPRPNDVFTIQVGVLIFYYQVFIC